MRHTYWIVQKNKKGELEVVEVEKEGKFEIPVTPRDTESPLWSEILRSEIENAGAPQDILARACGMKIQQFNDYLHGRKRPNVDTGLRMIRALIQFGVDPRRFLP